VLLCELMENYWLPRAPRARAEEEEEQQQQQMVNCNVMSTFQTSKEQLAIGVCLTGPLASKARRFAKKGGGDVRD